MAEIIKMPRMSDTMEEGNIIAWHKKEGDKVKPGDLLAEIETDKATMEFESLWEGQLLHIAVKEGSVPVEAVIAVIGKDGENWKDALQVAQVASNGNAPGTPTTAAPIASNITVTPIISATEPTTTGRIVASPLAKSLAKEAGLDLTQIAGTGDHGRIIKKDIESFLEKGPATATATATATAPATAAATAPATAPATATGQDTYNDTPVSQMRKTIARRLTESKFGAPHFYLTTEINMDKAVEARPILNELAAPVKISFNDIVLKAVAAALHKHPAVNTSWLGDRIRSNQNINIGVAVAVEDGLLVPVIRNADLKSLSTINQEVKYFAEKARNKKLQPEEMTGNTFTISNLGMFDIDEFTAIINPPDACILAIGSIVLKPIVKNGEIVPGNIMKVTLSCDHRVVDGVTGAQFLQTLKAILEEPIRLLV